MSPGFPVNAFITHLDIEAGSSSHTIEAYLGDIDRYVAWLAERDTTEPGAVVTKDIEDYLSFLRTEGRSSKTVARAFAAVRAFHRFMHGEGLTRANPTDTLGVSPGRRKLPDVLSIEEIGKLIEAPDIETPLGLRDRAMLEFAYATGSRVSELVNMTLQNVMLSEALVRIMGKGAKERMVPMGSVARKYVDRYLREVRSELATRKSRDVLFLSYRGNPMTRDGYWKLLKKYVIQAGITTHTSPHTLRHSFATHLLAGGADIRVIQELLGHATIATTEVYTHVDRSYLKEVHSTYHPRA